jgi:hypothetical protein
MINNKKQQRISGAMKMIFQIVLLITISASAFTQTVSGFVKDDKGNPLPNASVFIKDKRGGTSCNSTGAYFLNLSPGTYTLICQHVGYKRDVKTITVADKDITVDFVLNAVDFTMEEVIIRSGENPANEIIKNAIRMRSVYQKQLDEFICEVYTKGQMKLRDYPKKILGQKLDFGDGDTSKNKIIYLSETMSTYSVQKPNHRKVEVHSSKVSGQANSYGLAAPQFYSLYDNNVQIGTSLNPRGFISPISENATNYYKYKYKGAFFEDGKQISRIEVIPKRKYEPLFSGYINIVENDWRIHSLRLQLKKESQMEFLDSLTLEQVYVPYTDSLWVLHNQVIYPYVKLFGIDAYGSFVNVYSKFDPDPGFKRNYFDNTVLKYTDSSNRKTEAFWDDTRPMKLLDEEIKDYRKKDSIEQVSKNPTYLDSIDRVHNKFSITGILLTGQTFSKEKKRETYYFRPLTEQVSFNIVEGLVMNASGTYTKRLDSTVGRRTLRISPTMRYGFSNHHFNAWLSTTYTFGKKYVSSINISGGKRVFQFNNASPIGPRSNTLATLFGRNNLLKLYEAWYLRGSFTKGIGEGLTWSMGFDYQDRMPLENTTDYSIFKKNGKQFTPNYPAELVSSNITRHQAFTLNFGLTWQPGAKYIELPGQKINIGSKWPTFSLGYTRVFDEIVGSDVDYTKWRFSVTDILRLKLFGVLNYRLGMGGFIEKNKVEVPDYQHFNGNISTLATAYLNSFQILPIYEFSNTSRFYALAHVEHHFNGFLTNKIPGFRKLNWYLVTGVNAFHHGKTDYTEVFVGLENILKSFRIDYYWSFKDAKKFGNDFRIGLVTRLGRGSDD